MKTFAARLKGFTLIELLIVITIIGILAVALVPKITGGPAKARDAARKSDLQQLATAMEFFNDDNGHYPGLASGNAACVSTLSLSSYLTSIPNDPSDDGVGISPAKCSNDYTYYPLAVGGGTSISSNPDGYLLMAKLENENAKGDGIYEAGDYTGSFVNSDSASDNLNTNVTSCDTAICSGTNGPMYMIGR